MKVNTIILVVCGFLAAAAYVDIRTRLDHLDRGQRHLERRLDLAGVAETPNGS